MTTAKRNLLWVPLFGGLLLLGMATSGCKSDEPICTILEGQCPNFCTTGTGVTNEACASTESCGCGLFCDGTSGTCQAYAGDNAGCSCVAPGEEPDIVDTGVDTGPDLSCNGQPAPEGASCNPYCQKGCEEGEQCTFTNNNITCDGVGDLGLGEPCANSYECQEQMACFKLTDDPLSTCRQFCQKDADCPAERKCSLSVNFGAGFSAKFCSEPIVGCSVFDDQCGEGQACYYKSKATQCMAMGTLEKDAICFEQPSNACLPGLQCLVTCREACSTNDDNDDAPKCSELCGTEEESFQELSQENGLGVCLPDEPPAVCNLFTQEGCGSGQGCYSVTGGWGCITAGSGEPGEACTGGNECKKGTLCINSTCAEVCSLKEEDAGKDIHCDEKCGDSGQLSPTKWGIGFCKDADPAEPCDFWGQDCDGGKTCYALSNGASCLPTGGSVTEGEACSSIQDCSSGLICGSNKCRKACSIAAFPEGLCKPLADPPKNCEPNGGECADGETCTADSWSSTPPDCQAECSSNDKDINPVVPGKIGYCKD